MCESTSGLFRTELIRRQGPWRHINEIELATLEYVDWFNHRSIHGEIEGIPPAEKEANSDREHRSHAEAETTLESLHGTQAGPVG